jgi:hypothetical protein
VKQVLAVMGGVVLIGLMFAGASFATGPFTAQAPNARLALVVDGNATVGSFTTLRKKGVASVTNPYAGIYCITPSSSTMALGKIAPMVTLEVSGTPNPDTMVGWSRLLVYCPNGTIEVDSFQIGTRMGRNDVGFSLTVF